MGDGGCTMIYVCVLKRFEVFILWSLGVGDVILLCCICDGVGVMR